MTAQKYTITNAPGALVRYSEFFFKAILLLGIGMNLWLTQSFVTRKEFEKLGVDNTLAHIALQTALSDMAATQKLLAANVARLDDHEMRLRVVEARQTSVIERLTAAERLIDRAAAADKK